MAKELTELTIALQHIGVDASLLAPLGDNDEGLYRLTVPYDQTLDTWKALHKALPALGYWPVILTTEPEIGRLLEQMKDGATSEHDATTQTIIERGIALNPAEWLKTELEMQASADESFEFLHSHWPAPSKSQEPDDPDPYSAIALPHYLDYEAPAPNVVIGLCPTPHSWQTPAYLRFGGFNSCPPPDEHVGLLKHWHDNYGAEVVGIFDDMLQLYVPFPPSDRADAMFEAQLQLVYDNDLLDAETSVEELALMIMTATQWAFWWD